jgi:hypothetical protein
MKTKIVTLSILGIIFLLACDVESPNKELPKDHEIGWTPIDSNLVDDTDELPAVTEAKPPADTSLSNFLPKKIYEYLGDAEVQNSDHQTSVGITIKSVVRVYRKQELMIGINVSDFSKLSEKERKEIFDYNYKSLKLLSSKKGTTSKNITINKTVYGKMVFCKPLNKAVMIIIINNELLLTISSDTKIDSQKFSDITKLINFEKLKRIKQIS